MCGQGQQPHLVFSPMNGILCNLYSCSKILKTFEWPGHKIGIVKATDADLNSILTYSLSLPTQNFLNIDAQSGELSMTSSIDRLVSCLFTCSKFILIFLI